MAEPITPGADAEIRLHGALATATSGDVVRLGAGRFDFTGELNLTTPGVTLEGAGREDTVLSFAKSPPINGLEEGGVVLEANGLTLREFSVVDAKGAAVWGRRGLETITLSGIAVRQSGGLRPGNPGMGIRLFAAKHVLYERLHLQHAMTSGLQTTESEYVVVRNSVFENNTLGLEVENNYFVDVHDNVMTKNAAGVMFLDMPSYPHTGGHAIRVFRNRFVDNSGPTYMPPNGIGGTMSTGMGLLVMGGQHDIHIFDNEFGDNGHANITLVALPWQIDNPDFQAAPNDIVIRDNLFGRGGYAPFKNLAAYKAGGGETADVVWDGATTFIAGGQVKTSEPLRMTLADNRRTDGKAVTYLSLGLTIANGGMTVSFPTNDLPAPTTVAEPAPIRLPQDAKS